MLGVISEAYCNQIADKDQSSMLLAKSAKGDVDMTRIKAGILDEFEKSRDDYQKALYHARLISKQRLASRFKDSKSEEDSSNTPTQIEAMFEEGNLILYIILLFHLYKL